MAITSTGFVFFVLAALAGYHLVPAGARPWWLLLASYAFCATWGVVPVATLLALTLVDYALGRALVADGAVRRPLLWAGIAANLLPLALWKFAPVSRAPGVGGLLVPVGLSFCALQGVSYLVDVSRGQLPAERRFVRFAVYLAYFPKLLAGPIERARTFLPQLDRPALVDDDALARSVTLIATGLVRKLVIADPLAAMIPSAVFAHPANTPGLAPWLVVYAVGLYNDFAGYTSLVRGVSVLFGIELSPNFASPFFARSFTEFWNRWHISLSVWLRDYVYLPTSRRLLRRTGGRRNAPSLVVPPMATMLACGLWHGPGWNMLAWGALHGAYLVAERVVSLRHAAVPYDRRPLWRQVASALRVFACVTFATVFFRMDLPTARAFLAGLCAWRSWAPADPRMVLVVPSLWLDWLQVRRTTDAVFVDWPVLARAGLLAAAVLATFLVTRGDLAPPFVYQGF